MATQGALCRVGVQLLRGIQRLPITWRNPSLSTHFLPRGHQIETNAPWASQSAAPCTAAVAAWDTELWIRVQICQAQKIEEQKTFEKFGKGVKLMHLPWIPKYHGCASDQPKLSSMTPQLMHATQRHSNPSNTQTGKFQWIIVPGSLLLFPHYSKSP